MFAAGLSREVAGLLARGYGAGDPGLRGIGYREFFLMQRGCWTLSDLREAIQRNSRRYAKRQITFFKSLPGVEWLPAGEPERVVSRIEGFLGRLLTRGGGFSIMSLSDTLKGVNNQCLAVGRESDTRSPRTSGRRSCGKTGIRRSSLPTPASYR